MNRSTSHDISCPSCPSGDATPADTAEARLRAAVASAASAKYLYHAPHNLDAIFHLMVMLESYAHRSCVLRFVDEGTVVGDIVLCDGQVCLVRGTEGHLRLRALLAAHLPGSSTVIASSIDRALKEKRRLSGVLFENGIQLEHVRECLRVQATYGILAISASLRSSTLVAHELPLPGASDWSLAHSPRELYARVLQDQRHAGVTDVSRVFEKFSDAAAAAVLFRNDTDHEWVPESIKGADHLGFQDLVEMCEMVARAAVSAVARDPRETPHLITVGAGERLCMLLVGDAQCAMLIGATPTTQIRIKLHLQMHQSHRNSV